MVEAKKIMVESNGREGKLMASPREVEVKANSKRGIRKEKMKVENIKASLIDKENELHNLKE